MRFSSDAGSCSEWLRSQMHFTAGSRTNTIFRIQTEALMLSFSWLVFPMVHRLSAHEYSTIGTCPFLSRQAELMDGAEGLAAAAVWQLASELHDRQAGLMIAECCVLSPCHRTCDLKASHRANGAVGYTYHMRWDETLQCRFRAPSLCLALEAADFPPLWRYHCRPLD